MNHNRGEGGARRHDRQARLMHVDVGGKAGSAYGLEARGPGRVWHHQDGRLKRKLFAERVDSGIEILENPRPG